MNGPKIMFHIGSIGISETITTTWLIMLVLITFAYVGTRKLEKVPGKLQNFVEFVVDAFYGLVEQTMGKHNLGYTPYIGTLFLLFMLANLVGLLGLRAPTADLNTTLGMALVTFVLVQAQGLRNKGVGGYFKGFLEPLPALLPLNIISELANPVSLSFRLFGNIAGGMVITSLLYGFLAWVSTGLVGLPIPIFQVGVPAVLSIYFDLFTGVLQAFIFTMLTMVFVAMAE